MLKYANMTYGVEQDVTRFWQQVPIDPRELPVLKVSRGALSYKAPFLIRHDITRRAYYHLKYGSERGHGEGLWMGRVFWVGRRTFRELRGGRLGVGGFGSGGFVVWPFVQVGMRRRKCDIG